MIFTQRSKATEFTVSPVRTEAAPGLVSVRQLVVDKLIVGAAGRTALCSSLMEPEPHNCSVVFLTKTAHQPLVSNAWHNVGVLLTASVLLWLQHAVGVLSMLQCLK